MSFSVVPHWGVTLPEQSSVDLETPPPIPTKSVWQENHGNLLLAFSAIVLIGGAVILMYRQSRFVPVRFPDSDSISAPHEETDDGLGDRQNAIKISVTGAANDNGLIRVAFYETDEAFNDAEQAFLRLTLPIADSLSESLIPLEQLPDKFAIAAFHDENADGTLNRNRLGVPSERYGFSENARGLTGPPTYREALTNRPEVGGTIDVSIR